MIPLFTLQCPSKQQRARNLVNTGIGTDPDARAAGRRHS
jgi:hypothetical protein